MTLRFVRPVIRLFILTLLPVAIAAAQAQKPLTNADVEEMVNSKLPESTIIGSMQANPTSFDVSPAALIALNKVGVSAKIMDAMIAVSSRSSPRGSNATARAPRPSGPARAPAGVTPRSGQPSAVLVQNDTRQNLSVERTKLLQTTAKGKSLGALSKDQLMNQALRTGMSEALTATGGSVVGSAVGRAGGGLAGSIFSGKGKPKDVTFVWAVQGGTSETILSSDQPSFEVSLGKTLGVRTEEYAPAIVKLTPTANDWRLVGATEGKERAGSRSAMDWPIYSAFIEDRVPVTTAKSESGDWRVSVTAPLAPGEYALVLRPDSKSKKFSGSDVARNQGDGVLFNALWSFVVR